VRPAWSVILFTTLSDAGQGLFLALFAGQAFGALGGAPSVPPTFLAVAVVVSLALVGAGLFASIFHLGHPERGWRAAARWRTSWRSGRGIVLLLFMALTPLSGALQYLGMS
jgi:DMSO reductase anchor subunit